MLVRGQCAKRGPELARCQCRSGGEDELNRSRTFEFEHGSDYAGEELVHASVFLSSLTCPMSKTSDRRHALPCCEFFGTFKANVWAVLGVYCPRCASWCHPTRPYHIANSTRGGRCALFSKYGEIPLAIERTHHRQVLCSGNGVVMMSSQYYI